MKKAPRWLRRLGWSVVLLVALPLAAVLYANLAAAWAGRGALHDDLEDVPKRSVGLVFGTTNKIGKRDNLYFNYRMEAAAALWKAGKVEILLVSGDNRNKYYNEPVLMREALIALGVPADKVVCDFAGLRTLDSVVRAKKVFEVPDVTFISQRFQNERAAYIAKANGMKFSGYNARDVGVGAGFRTKVREALARVKMWLDVNILDTQPRHLGPREILPLGESEKEAPELIKEELEVEEERAPLEEDEPSEEDGEVGP